MVSVRSRLLLVTVALLFVATSASAATRGLRDTREGAQPTVRLPGHVLPALAKATVVPSKAHSGAQPLTLTIVLRRDHQADFERYLHAVYAPHSQQFHHFLTQREIADRFGPSRADYDAVLAYLRAHGFRLVHGSANRLTLTVRGTRTQVD
ncbi:MAG: protease pro-enzyme activation domain-containing protein, partial [Candidatus Binataceae bacterium]